MIFSHDAIPDSRWPLELADHRVELHAWLDAHRDELASPLRTPTARGPRATTIEHKVKGAVL